MATETPAEVEKLVLKPGVVYGYLAEFAPTNDMECYQFTDLMMSGKRLETLNKAMEEVKDVHNIDISNNNVGDISTMKEMQNVVCLNVAQNKIKSLLPFTQAEYFQNLRWLDVSNNKLAEFPNFAVPNLEFLDISYNKLEKWADTWQGHEKLRVIKSVENKFKSLAVFKNLPKLEELYLYNNAISSFAGWENLPALKKLHLRRNKIDKIEEEGLPELPALEYLNLRSNKIEKIETIERIFAQFPEVKDLNVLNNPVESDASSFNVLLADVLTRNVKLTRFCKVTVQDSNLLESVFLAQYRWEESEKER